MKTIDVTEKDSKRRADLTKVGLHILQPRPPDKSSLREELDWAFTHTAYLANQDFWDNLPKTGEAKDAARKLAVALRKLEIAQQDPMLDMMLWEVIPEVRLKALIKQCDQIANKKRVNKRDAKAKMHAAKSAITIMYSFKFHIATTKGSKFCKLASLIYSYVAESEPDADLHHQCRAVVKSAKPGRK